jgi:hypothetical protein
MGLPRVPGGGIGIKNIAGIAIVCWRGFKLLVKDSRVEVVSTMVVGDL